MRLIIEPTHWGRYQWWVEDEEGRIISMRHGGPCLTLGEAEEDGAQGKARTRWGAKFAGRVALGQIAELRRHMAKERIVIEIEEE